MIEIALFTCIAFCLGYAVGTMRSAHAANRDRLWQMSARFSPQSEPFSELDFRRRGIAARKQRQDAVAVEVASCRVGSIAEGAPDA